MHFFKSCVLVALFVTANGNIDNYVEDPIEPYMFEDVINKTLESIRPNIPDPIKVEILDINLPETEILNGTMGVKNLEITGLKGFQVPFLQLNPIGMLLNFTFVLPTVNVNTYYHADILLAQLIPLYGSGKANIHLSGFAITGSGQASISGGISVKNVAVFIEVGDLTFDIHGMLDDEDLSLLVSSILNDVVGKFINDNSKLISNIISPIAELVINAILKGNPASIDVTP